MISTEEYSPVTLLNQIGHSPPFQVRDCEFRIIFIQNRILIYSSLK